MIDDKLVDGLPKVDAGPTQLESLLTILFGTLGAVAVLIIIVQSIRFIMSQGDSQKAADARRGVIYAIVGLALCVSAEFIVRLVIGKL